MNAQHGRTLQNSDFSDDGFLHVNNSGYYENAELSDVNRPKGRTDYQLIFVGKGTVHISLQGKVLRLQKNDFFIFAPNTPQRYSFDNGEPHDFYWIHFSGFYISTLLALCKLDTETVYHGDNACAFLVKDAIKQITSELQIKLQNSEIVAASMLQELLAKLPRYLKAERKTDDLFKEIVAEFERNFASVDNVALYAKRNDLSPVYFIRAFKRYTGFTPKQYLLKLRMEKAKELLSSSDMKVNEIARACGFESPFYFSKLFRRYFGVPPTRF